MTDTNQLPEPELGYIKTDKSNQPAFSARQMREAMTERELELIDGMITVQLDHAQRCDAISNRDMAEKQKGWDMERVELLRRIRSLGITAHAQVQGEPVLFIHPDTFAMNNAHVGAWKPGHELTGYIPLYRHPAVMATAMLTAKEGTNGEIN